MGLLRFHDEKERWIPFDDHDRETENDKETRNDEMKNGSCGTYVGVGSTKVLKKPSKKMAK